MKNSFGANLNITIFGESHGVSVGFVLDGMPAGIPVDTERMKALLALRRPSGAISTSRSEADEFVIHSGVFEGHTTGTPVCVTIPNSDTRSKDYSAMKSLARPSHADYTAECKYHGFQDYRGGGHFSGRVTAALVAAGGIIIPALEKKGILIGTHLDRCVGVKDRDFADCFSDIKTLSERAFPVLDDSASEAMQEAILEAKSDGDSVGGVLETAVIGLEAGIGEPWFDSLEGVLSHALFSIPGIKGVEFGDGFALSYMRGSQANDPLRIVGGRVVTETNRAGGINGGISNGMPVIFRCAVRPTPTIAKEQNTVDIKNNTESTLSTTGRHDPCIAHRARVVVDSVTAFVIADMLVGRHGTDWLAE